jgi:hypothetical protein
MPSRQITFLAGGSVAALILGIGMASLALAPVHNALKSAPMRGAPPSAFQAPPPTTTTSQSAPIEVASLAVAKPPRTRPAPLDTPLVSTGDEQMVSADDRRSDQDGYQDDPSDSSDDGPRVVAAPAPSNDVPWRRHRARRPDDDAPRFLPAPPPQLEYPQDPDTP